MSVNGGMGDYITREEFDGKLAEEMGKLRAELNDKVDGHAAELMKGITEWSQQKEEEVMTAREQGALLAEPALAVLRESAARMAATRKEMQEERERFFKDLRRRLEGIDGELVTVSRRDEFHGSRLQRIEERIDRLEDRLYHGDVKS